MRHGDSDDVLDGFRNGLIVSALLWALIALAWRWWAGR